MTTRDPPALPNWPAMMDLPLAAAYCCIGEDSFRSLVARGGVRPVDLGTSSVRWRRTDLDALIDKLPVRPIKLPDGQPPESPPAEVVQLHDPAETALDRARRRARR